MVGVFMWHNERTNDVFRLNERAITGRFQPAPENAYPVASLRRLATTRARRSSRTARTAARTASDSRGTAPSQMSLTHGACQSRGGSSPSAAHWSIPYSVTWDAWAIGGLDSRSPYRDIGDRTASPGTRGRLEEQDPVPTGKLPSIRDPPPIPRVQQRRGHLVLASKRTQQRDVNVPRESPHRNTGIPSMKQNRQPRVSRNV